jgi:SOS-response transcriptional repressor LexA
MSFGKNLKKARKEAGLTQDQIGALFDPIVTRVTVSNWERDENMPDADKLPILARAVRRTIDQLYSGRSNTSIGPEIQGKVPLISWVQAGNFSQAVDNNHPGVADEWIETTVPVHRHTYALRVKGDSMTNPNGEPTFPHGQIIIVEPDAIDAPAKLVGSFVIVRRNGDDEATFKQVVRDGGKYFLKPLNPQYQMIELQEHDEFCGVVREKTVRYF